MTGTTEAVTVLVVDDNPVVRSGLLALLGLDDRLRVVGEAANGEQALGMARALHPRVVLLDVQMPVRDGVSAATELSALAHVVMTTFSDAPEVVHAAVAAGASGYLVHGTFTEDEIVSCVLAAAAGNAVFGPLAMAALRTPRTPAVSRPAHDLSARQVEIMELIARGATNGDIARELYLAEKTVKNHVNQIFARLCVRNRAEAIALWLGGITTDQLKPL